jgi:DNA-binding transcriptional ArsR family regulator
MKSVAVIDDPAAAEASLDPIRTRLLAELTEPRSATMLAATIGLPRQQVNYHLKTLERHGLAELVEERRKGNVNEKLFQATAFAYVISPLALGAIAPDPDRDIDEWSARWLLALGARLVQEVGQLIASATKAKQKLATFGVDTEVTFATAADRAAFAAELTETIARLVADYHRPNSARGRRHRLIVAVHPSITKKSNQTTEGK